MKRTLTILIALTFLAAATSVFADEHKYGWTISGSNSDPMVNSGAATLGIATVYLWFQCSTVDGMASAEFDVVSTGIVHLATIPQNGYLNAGGTASLLLAVGGCPPGPVVAANFLITDLPGEMCFVPSAANGINGTVDCDPAPALHDNDTIGYSSQGAPASCVGNLCLPDPVVGRSWGEIKGLYR